MSDHVHRPGRPQDLPHPRLIWSHGALAGLVNAALGEPTDAWPDGCWLTEDEGVGRDDGGGNWWSLKPFPGGRAVLFGEDHEMSRTRFRQPPLDLLSGAPDWCDRAWFRPYDDLVGYVYWFDSGAWHRVPYPDDVADDGLELTAGEYLRTGHVVFRAGCELTETPFSTPVRPRTDLDPAAAEGVRVGRAILEAGAERSLTAELLRDLLEGLARVVVEEDDPDEPPSYDPDAALGFARRAGFTADGPVHFP